MTTNSFPEFSFPVTVLILAVIMLVRYFFMAGTLSLYVRYRKVPPLSKIPLSSMLISRDIRRSLLSTFIFAIAGSVMIKLWLRGYTKIYLEWTDFPFWYLPLSLILYLVIHDAYFYWTHRLLHLWRYKDCHYAHHESRRPTAWTSFSFHPMEAIIQALVLPILVILVPIHWVLLITFLILMSLFGVTNHLGVELFPKFMEKKLFIITASHHQSHHERPSSNFGLYFTLWDQLMGTEERKGR